MRSKKMKYYISVALIFVLLTASMIYAASMYRLSYVERFETGNVDIHIQELSGIEEGENIEVSQLADANRQLSYVPRIVNSGAECYIRAKVKIDTDGDCEQPLKLENIYGLGNGWISKGDYFYYTKSLEEKQWTDLFKGLHVPEDWKYGDAEALRVEINAEAIQSANFKPDFQSDMPWGAVELKEVATASGNECVEATPVSVISSVEYDSEGGFQCRTSDLFEEFTGMMPGDCFEKTIKIKNSARNPLRAYLNVTAAEGDLGEKLDLVVFCDSRELYSGSVAALNEKNGLSIIDVPKGKSENVTFRICLPADTDNDYETKVEDLIWEFNVEEVSNDSVQTGDYSALIPYAVIAAFAILIMAGATVNNRKGKNETHN